MFDDPEDAVAVVTIIIGFIILLWSASAAYSYGKSSDLNNGYDKGYKRGYEKVTYCLTVYELDPTNVDRVWNCREAFRKNDIDGTIVEELAKAKREQNAD